MKIAVIGAGVAGAATALALRHIGAEVTIIESHEDPGGTVGSYVSLAANALRGLGHLGCLDQVKAAGFDVPWQRMWGASGRLLGEVPRGRRTADQMISVTLMRGALVSTLRAAAIQAGARIELGRRVETPSDVDADLIVGADGMWSATRQSLNPDLEAPKYAGMYSVSGFSAGEADPDVFNMTFAAPGAFIHLQAPDGRVWWTAQVSGVPGSGSLASLAELYRGTAHVARVLADATEVGTVVRHHVLDDVPHWNDERVVLVGDAAHPVGSGQGAAMAIEDAVVLARALEARGCGPEGLATFVETRRGRVAKVLKAAGDNTGAKTAGPWKRRMNEAVMGVFVPRFYERATEWLYGFDVGEQGVKV